MANASGRGYESWAPMAENEVCRRRGGGRQTTLYGRLDGRGVCHVRGITQQGSAGGPVAFQRAMGGGLEGDLITVAVEDVQGLSGQGEEHRRIGIRRGLGR